jgi:hypothetical protein
MGQHEVSEGWIGKVKQSKDKESTNYFMWLTIDGQKQRRATAQTIQIRPQKCCGSDVPRQRWDSGRMPVCVTKRLETTI